MSLSGALYNAFSGLRANSRAATLVSGNIANATTESYGRRTLALSAPGLAGYGGVRIDGVQRNVDPVLIADRRISDAALGFGTTLSAFAGRIETAAGASGEPGSLATRAAAFENALLTAAANPASTQRLESVATSADALAASLNVLAEQVQQERNTADRQIGQQVTRLNDAIGQVQRLNADIVAGNSSGTDVSSLLDERQRVIDGISEIAPLRIVARDRGEVALFTTGGALLLDGIASEVGFVETPAIEAGMTLAGGQLSGLTLAGQDAADRLFAGGTLAAEFQVRDGEAVARQEQLDGIARDLIERLDPGGPDTTLGATDPGLFTDLGAAFDPLDETGLAGRISLNALVAPGSGGAWRLRDGLGAVTQGEVGDARLLQGITQALATSAPPSSAALDPLSRSFSMQISEFASTAASARVRQDNELSFLSTQNTALKELEFSKGVDTDQELQRLMQIEQHYAANAQVMSVVDEMMDRLMRI